jgi:SWI/SNF-related matrix-associated actin-dependent regulator 1 of chromatin subfamily A
MLKLYPFQETGVQFLLRTPWAILGDSMGLGKTVQAIELVNRSPGSTLVVCPAFLKGNWTREIEKFAKDPSLFTVISYSKLKNLNTRYDNTLVDECHYLKNPDAQRTNHFFHLVTDFPPKRLVLMSGTPIKNRVGEFWSLLYLVGAIKIDYWDFCKRFSNLEKFRIGNRNVTRFTGHRNVPELKKILSKCYLRRKASEVLDLPPITRVDVELEPDFVDKDLLQAWNEESPAFASMKKHSALIKASHTAKYVKDILEQGEGPVVIFTDHIEPTMEISDILKSYKVGSITGATSMPIRDQIVTSFQDKKLDVIVATTGSLSVGVTLTAARHLVFNDLPFVPGDLLQAEKRIHRISQDRPCVVHRVFYGKIDAHIGKTLSKKISTLKEVL